MAAFFIDAIILSTIRSEREKHMGRTSVPKGKDIWVMPSLDLYTVINKKQLELLEDKFDVTLPLSTQKGSTYLIEDTKTGRTVHVVYISVDEKASKHDVNALIAHESYHVARNYLQRLGEDNPGEEVMAYTIQEISYHVMADYWSQLEK